MKVYRVYVEKKPGFDVAAGSLLSDFTGFLRVKAAKVRLLVRYDLQGLSEEDFERIVPTVLSEPMCDIVWREELPPLGPDTRALCYEALPGQFDIRADSCAQCVQMLLGGDRPLVRCATALLIDGVSESELARVSAYVINPVESCPAPLEPFSTLERRWDPPAPIETLHGFCELADEGLDAFVRERGLAMDGADLRCLREYFRGERRDPTATELKVLDTYWSDHCRHTTFHTVLDELILDDPRAAEAYRLYRTAESGPLTLMSLATAAMKRLLAEGKLDRLDRSPEVNACTAGILVDTPTGQERWLLFFKNETHNHPTEIEPYGGAATCLGGAIRDPMSGRAYVYQAMRLTGAGDPRAPLEDTLPGKLPQRRLTTLAAAGYSSYGNQVGLTSGHIREIYHPGYVAKRMELGAVVGAAPASAVRREEPAPGDVVILLGGRTGRDGIGGATGSSKTHDQSSVSTCAAEVQKGDPPEERKMQRLFRKPEVTRLIKRCNDFGAGGVAVAVGELAAGLRVDLDRVPRKYDGLDGTEIAISESQERLAIVVAASDAERFIAQAAAEDLEATVIAEVTADPRLVMVWQGRTIADISRTFLDSAGARKHARARVAPPSPQVRRPWEDSSLSAAERILLLASDLNFCSQRGLVERFDGTIGAGSVLLQHGGPAFSAPEQVMAALVPAPGSRTASVMGWGFDPYVAQADPFGGAARAVVTSLAKLTAAGCSLSDAYLSFQEYFPKTGSDPDRWGLPAAALLGAFWAQMGLGVAAVGGKDSMSGSFEHLDVPPALVSFSIATAPAGQILPSHLQGAGHTLVLFEAPRRPDGLPDLPALRALWDTVHAHIRQGRLLSAYAVELGGVPGALAHMSLSDVGVRVEPEVYGEALWDAAWGSIVAESAAPLEGGRVIGMTQSSPELALGRNFIPLSALTAAWSRPLEDIFPVSAPSTPSGRAPALSHAVRAPSPIHLVRARPRVVLPIFPGTNCEVDTAAALERAGAEVETVLVRNARPQWLSQSLEALEAAVRRAQIMILPGGFSGGDEPDGSAKFITAFLRAPRLTQAVRDLLHRRDGLMLGICNGFQALIKLGLVPYGDIRDMDEDCPTLAFNAIGRHQARYVHTRVSSVLSPWLSRMSPGDIHTLPVSHGEGRFVCPPALLDQLVQNGQIAFQYCDGAGVPFMDTGVNPNGSALCVEGLTSPDGRVLGKMAHVERAGRFVAVNIPGEKFQPLFEGGVNYFS